MTNRIRNFTFLETIQFFSHIFFNDSNYLSLVFSLCLRSRINALALCRIACSRQTKYKLTSFYISLFPLTQERYVTNGSGQGTSAGTYTVTIVPPSSPTSLSATTASSSQINLSWTASATGGPTIYRILRSAISGSEYTQIDSVNGATTTYNNTGLTPSTQYFYVVQAGNTAGPSAYSNEAFATTNGVPPAPPTSLVANAVSTSQIDLTWTGSVSGNPSKYRITRSATVGGTYSQIDSVGSGTFAYFNTGLASGTQFFYQVIAVNAFGYSAPSNTANATTGAIPSVPGGLTATAASASQINLTWNSSTNSPSVYRVYRSTTSGAGFTQIDSVNHPTLTYASIGLTANTQYFYKISAANTFGSSAQSAEQPATTLPPPPSAPTGLTATKASSSQINLSWTASTGSPTRYRILRSATSGTGFGQIDSVSHPTVVYNNTSLQPNTAYFYLVTALNSGGVSAASNEATATTDPITPSFGTITPNPASPDEGQAVTVTAGVINAPSEVKLFYGKNSQTAGDSVTMSLVSGNYTAQIPSGSVAGEGIWFRIRARNSAAVVWSPSSTGRTAITVKVASATITNTRSTGIFPTGLPTKKFFTVSLPFSTTINLTSVLGPQELGPNNIPTNWRALTYSPTSGQFNDVTTLSGGQSYFIRQNVSGDIFSFISTATSSSPDAFNNIVLPAGPGWNLIPWPYPFAANVLVTDNSKIGSVWQLHNNNNWDPVSQLVPFGGYAIYNKTSSTVTLGQVISWTQAAKVAANHAMDWSIQIKAETESASDNANFAGIRSDAISGHDYFDEAEPMGIGEFVSLAFTSVENSARKLAFDVRPQGEVGHVWNFAVENKTSSHMVLLDFVSLSVPSSLHQTLIDISNNRIVNLDLSNQYEFSSGKQNQFKLLVGSQDFISSEVQQFSLLMPKSFELKQNFPNPFNPSTTVAFGLVTRSQVEIQIYNILGQKVYTLASSEFPAGFQSVLWNGKNDGHSTLSSGVYIYRITVNELNGSGKSYSKSRKMLLLK